MRGLLEMAASLSKQEEELLFDPQTSGGLLLSVPADQAERLVSDMRAAGVEHAVRIGEVQAGDAPGVKVL